MKGLIFSLAGLLATSLGIYTSVPDFLAAGFILGFMGLAEAFDD